MLPSKKSFADLAAITLVSWLALFGGLAACSGSAPALDDPPAADRGSERVLPAPADTLQLTPVPDVTFGDARALSIDPFGLVYVADAARHVVVKLRPSGAVDAVLGGPGSRAGEFDGPSGVDATNGLILIVADANNRRLQRFSRSHAFLGSVPLTSSSERDRDARITYRRDEGGIDGFGSGRPGAVVTSDTRETYAVDIDRNIVLKWDEDLRRTSVIGGAGAGPGTLAEPVDLAVGPRSQLFVADRRRGAVIVFDEFGNYLRSIGPRMLSDVRAVAIAGNEVLVLGTDRMVRFDMEGAFIGSMALHLEEPPVDIGAEPYAGLSRDALLADRPDLRSDQRHATVLLLTPSRLYRARIRPPSGE